MRSPSNLSRASLGFNMTPMIDVVFLLIIFFLVSSHLARQEVRLELDLPTAASGRRPSEEDIRRVVVNVLPAPQPEGQIQVGGRLISAEELAGLIRYERSRDPRPLEVRIRADRRARYRMVEPILTGCAQAGVWNVSFAVVAGD